jgi:opine dehydrogenase
MNDIFAGYVKFIPGKNLLEVDLDNPNQTLHPLPVLLNYGGIENHPETFRHYMDGITPLISEKMMQMDEERLAIGSAFSLELMSTLEQLKMYEDVPGLNVPAMQLAEKAVVETPIIELTVRLTSWLHSVDYVSTGTNLEKLGIANKTPEEIVSLTT